MGGPTHFAEAGAPTVLTVAEPQPTAHSPSTAHDTRLQKRMASGMPNLIKHLNQKLNPTLASA